MTVIARYMGSDPSLNKRIAEAAGREPTAVKFAFPSIDGKSVAKVTVLEFTCADAAEAESIDKALEALAGVEAFVQK